MPRRPLFASRKRRRREPFVGTAAGALRELRPVPFAYEKALSQAILWCDRHDLTTSSDDPDYLRNVQLLAARQFPKIDFAALSPLADQLRSPELKPAFSLGTNITDAARQDAVAKLVEERGILLSKSAGESGALGLKAGGRLLITAPAENVADGASQVGSLGFFDENDIPPWDTWVAFVDGDLLSWVPESLIGLAQDGIDANPVQCIWWADSVGRSHRF